MEWTLADTFRLAHLRIRTHGYVNDFSCSPGTTAVSLHCALADDHGIPAADAEREAYTSIHQLWPGRFSHKYTVQQLDDDPGTTQEMVLQLLTTVISRLESASDTISD